MKIVRFIRTGEAIPDVFMNKRVIEFIESNHDEWEVSNWLTMDHFRVAVKEGVINKSEYQFFVEDLDGILHEITIDNDGRCPKWYDSSEVFSRLLDRLL